MKIVKTNFKYNLLDLKKDEYIKIIKRKSPNNSHLFFKTLFKSLSSASGFVNYPSASQDIERILQNKFSSSIRLTPFYKSWISDMGDVCKVFCKFLNDNRISFWIGTQRGCSRFHVDMVPYRLLLTYFGQGTEILPNHAADRRAFTEGKTNKDIIKNKSAINYIKKWDIAIFKGGNRGILHRTPDSALNDNSSILMRLDTSSFLESIKKINKLSLVN